jgi:hypothetical protein
MDPNGQDPRLEEAMRRSPELAAMMAGKREDPLRRYRRLAAILAALAIAVAGVWLAARAISARRHARDEPAAEIDNAVYLRPLKTERQPSGEETSPFTGFAVAIDTVPAGAVITIGGKLRGEAPVLANVDCQGTEILKVVARKEGFRPATHELKCRADELVKLKLVLER